MISQATLDKLREMKMSSMADQYLFQLEDPNIKNLSFDERFAMLVDIEYTSRQNARLKKLIQNAEMDQPHATIAGINFECGRRLLQKHHNIIITGATGSGKTYLACAFGMEACKQFITTHYIRLPELLLEMKLAREGNKMKKILQRFTRPELLIVDEWLLIKCPQDSQYDLMEVIHHRTKSGSTIFCSQFRVDGWYEQLGGTSSPLADAILDRIIHSSYKINIEPVNQNKDFSMREIFGSIKS